MATVIAPVDGFSGVVAGVSFTDGRATTDDPRALAYFRRHGYTVDRSRRVPGELGQTGPVDAQVELGTPLRDAAVDPKPEDYLPPTNAGNADPHGPAVVSPEIHGAGPADVAPGPVDPDPDAQEADETAHAVDVLEVELEQPAKNGSKAAWLAYAVSKGADEDQVHDLTRDELAEQFGS